MAKALFVAGHWKLGSAPNQLQNFSVKSPSTCEATHEAPFIQRLFY